MDIELIIFAAVAFFVLYRLYSVLGTKTGAEPPPSVVREATQKRKNSEGSDESNVTPFRPSFTGPGASAMEEISQIDSTFSPSDFTRKSKKAYEMIVEAFAEGDKETLSNLLVDDVYEAYVSAIDEREQNNTEPLRLMRLKSAEIADAELLDGDIGQVSVSFEAQLSDGENLRTAKEIWTFERSLKSSNPAWLLGGVSEAS
ncbi:Tim44/TimA family putative adaptor protein [Hirschia baltica]|uniref:Import inner membrane translocase subunit Tim44 n=1 Tax=Hirschia baltica (strain ATCC 49814 / DSM 5838 / IFAM 1418) TaxID=582402 RepID=C6XIK2_HIRBI|nr:Tim44/TimA family putative adaptor protein [Hirschia baltica]ACT60809.1 import inner membrane translocase subunit Tim44 [Hirschia baltica ATCC 49814]